MPKSQTATVNQVRAAHAVSDSCRAISGNLRETNDPGDQESGTNLKSEDTNLSPQQCLAIGHLLAGQSYTKTAELLHIDPRTLYEWRQNPAFIARMNELSHQTLEAVAMRTRNLLLRATERLERSMDGMMMFGDVLRVVSSKRIWDMAHVMPGAVSGETDRLGEESKGGAKGDADVHQ